MYMIKLKQKLANESLLIYHLPYMHALVSYIPRALIIATVLCDIVCVKHMTKRPHSPDKVCSKCEF